MNNSYKKYLVMSAAIIGGLYLACGLFNYLVDPYCIYRTGKYKPGEQVFTPSSRMSKPYWVKAFKPDSLLLGSSRTDIGLDPQHSAWGEGRVLNLALKGALPYELMRSMEHAVMVRTPKRVLLCVDFFMMDKTSALPASFSEGRMSSTGFNADDIASTLLSLTALEESLKKLAGGERDMTIDGMACRENERERILKKGGYRKGFIKTENSYVQNHWRPGAPNKFNLSKPGERSFESIRRMIEQACKEKIKLTIVISPVHSRLLMTIYLCDLWPQFQQFKRNLLEINQTETAKYGLKPFPLWDFAAPSFYNNEPVPAEGDYQTTMSFYWECSHYTPDLGNLMLDLVLNGKSNRLKYPFGTRLDLGNINQILDSQEKMLKDYISEHPDADAEIEAIIANYQTTLDK
ncbi:MAG: hypothetical protein WC071_08940 [Victivallaceae bacterium]